MTTLKLHSDGKVSRSGETKLERFEASSPKNAEEEIANRMKTLKDKSKMFQRTSNDEVKKISIRGCSGERNSYNMY